MPTFLSVLRPRHKGGRFQDDEPGKIVDTEEVPPVKARKKDEVVEESLFSQAAPEQDKGPKND